MNQSSCLCPGQKRRMFATLSAGIIDELIPAVVNHHDPAGAPVLPMFWLTRDHFPFVIKFRGNGTAPVADRLYRVEVDFEPKCDFLDQGGKKCTSRDRIVVRVYEDRVPEDAVSEGEMRWTVANNGQEQCQFFPAPSFLQPIQGKERKAYLWVAHPEVEYAVRDRDQTDEVIFVGNVVVQLPPATEGEEHRVPGAIARELPCGITVYDRRVDRVSPFAKAEHIRRTLGRGRCGRSFEIVNLREVTTDELRADLPKVVLTEDGLKQVLV